MKEMVDCKNRLCELGYDGWIHPHYEALVRGERPEHADKIFNKDNYAPHEHAAIKRENDYLRVHYRHICESDAILVVNNERHGVQNYIGGNVLIEMGQAYVNNKKIFLLNDVPDMPYTDEILAMDPQCLNGDLAKINRM